MKMKRWTAAVLLMLSLGALAAGRLSAAVADDGVDTILLPSHGLADESVTATGDGEKRPWGKCCDHTFCNRRMPPGCRCMDAVDRCDDACSRCEAHPSDPSKRICMDRYTGEPGPTCTEPSNNGDDGTPGPGVGGHEDTVAVAATEEAMPWKCCDDTLCTRSAPPTCQCRDKVKKCAKACKNCEKADDSKGASSLYVCRDLYFGWSPKCNKSVTAGDFLNGQPGEDLSLDVPEATAEAVSKMNVNDGEEETRPWKCCDLARCTRSFPPTCQCMDKVKKCAKTCKSCKKVEGSSLYVCQDSYGGWPGATCTPTAPPPPTFTPRGN